MPTIFLIFLVILVADIIIMHKTFTDKFLLQFGNHLGEIRNSKNLSFRALSQKCEIDYADLNKIEKGKRNITLSTILELAKGLEIHPKELFDFSVFVEDLEK